MLLTMSDPHIVFDIKLRGIENAVRVAKDPDQLRSLCRDEVNKFDQYLRRYGEEYVDGLSKFERLAIEGYLYQKLRGRVDAQNDPG